MLVGGVAITGWSTDSCVTRFVQAWEVVVCGARSAVFSVLDSDGARFAGILVIRNRIERTMLDRFDETTLALSRFRFFFLRFPFGILVISFVWLTIWASVEFLSMQGPRLFLY